MASPMLVRGLGVFTRAPTAAARTARMTRADRPGEHLWTFLAVWAVSDPERPEMHLDSENILEIAGPGCFKCEREYSRKLARRPCLGSAT